MKLNIEIKDNMFEYSFEVGKERGSGTSELNVTGLSLFLSALQHCRQHWGDKTDKEIQEIRCMAYIEKHPELLKKYKKWRTPNE